MSVESPATVALVKDEAGLIAKLGAVIEDAANKAIEKDEIFKIGLSGTIKNLLLLKHVSLLLYDMDLWFKK